MSAESFDVAVIGAGPAGATAAALLAEKEHRVALIDREGFPRKSTSIGWLSARAAPMLKALGVKDKSLLARPFKDVLFLDGDLVKEARPEFGEPAGYLIDRVAFGNALVAAAQAKGATLYDGNAAQDLQLQEDGVAIPLSDGRSVESRLLLLASGRETPLLQRAGLGRYPVSTIVWTAQIDAPLEKGAGPAKPRVVIVLGLDKAGSFGFCALLPDRMCITINWCGDRAEAIRVLIELCQRLYHDARQVSPIDLSAAAGGAKPVPSAAAAALDMDTHVGKHTLLIGEAGRFIAAASNEGIYPAMWSARIAVEVTEKALHSVHSQDELMTFNSQWRIEMADYLRPPNTDSQFLLPLIFSNQPMADRMGAAFFFGENI